MVVEYLGAAKLGFDSVRAALGVLKDVKEALPTDEQRKALGAAVDASEQQFAIAEAQVALALGYELCKCQFPPTIMLQVGYGIGRPTPLGEKAIYECPKCHACTAGMWDFHRTQTLPD